MTNTGQHSKVKARTFSCLVFSLLSLIWTSNGLHDQRTQHHLFESRCQTPTISRSPASVSKLEKRSINALTGAGMGIRNRLSSSITVELGKYSLESIQEKRQNRKRITGPLHLIIIGGPASGKGTQCEHISSKYGVVHLSTGDMLREAVKSGTKTGKIAKGFMDAGILVPDEMMIDIVSKRLEKDDCKERGWLLDGFPRTHSQAQHLKLAGINADIAVLLQVPDSALVRRVVGRQLDPVTGKIYHMDYNPPPRQIVGRLEKRSDDTFEKINVRLRQFHSNLSDIRSLLHDSLIAIDGSGSPENVAKNIGAAIDRAISKQRIRSSSIA